ncbi:PREDICTED: putative calcium-binding protein CML19 [Ipomoea nil]|uniref:putative calcium-binding protein CML19 n=1 Tax=Ipomoea nil TaxID=35883 RepID=UPI000901B6F9|nr:PREDICTED: putative calcium-binding protein CML19 [Ipomoea nil]
MIKKPLSNLFDSAHHTLNNLFIHTQSIHGQLRSDQIHNFNAKQFKPKIMENNKKQQYQRVFDCFDENKDGKLSAAELQRCMASIGDDLTLEEAEEAMLRMGCGEDDGLLGFEEFVRLLEDGNDEDKARDLKEAFSLYEMDDGCGCITPKSLKRMLSRLGESRTIDDCKDMIAHYDLNGDGLLNFDEFKVMMSC